MKFSKRTLSILANFAEINQNLLFYAGNKIRTKSQYNYQYAEADIEEHIERDFAVFQLRRFLDVINIFDQPDVTFGEKYLEVTEGQNTIRYLYCEPSHVISPPNKEIPPLPSDATFMMTDAIRKTLLSSMAALKVTDIAIVGSDGKISIRAFDAKEHMERTDSIRIDVGECDEDFRLNFPLDWFKIMPGDYEANIAFKKNKFLKLGREGILYVVNSMVNK